MSGKRLRLLVAGASVVAVTAWPGFSAEPRPSTHALLTEVAHAAPNANLPLDSFGVSAWSALRDRIREIPEQSISEVVSFLGEPDRTFAERVAVLQVVRHASPSAEHVMGAVAEHLLSPDAALRRAAESVAALHVPATRDGRDFSHIAGLLIEANAPRNNLLILWAMRTDPQAALKDFAMRLLGSERATNPRWREVVYAQHMIEDSLWLEDLSFIDEGQMTPEAAKQLDLLTASPEWWVRLYVVEVMLRHSYTATPARLASLCADPDQRVAERVSGLCPTSP